MIQITLEGGYVTFYTSVSGAVASNVESCEVVDKYSYNLATSFGVYLININDSTINGITFSTSAEAVTYILNN
jgi:hypothetical protein